MVQSAQRLDGVDQKGKRVMLTQEERLTALEQVLATFQKEAALRVRGLEENTTILLGIVQSQELDLKRIFRRLSGVEDHLITLEQQMNTQGQQLTILEEHVTTLEQQMESRFEAQDKKLDQILLLLNTSLSKPDQQT